MSLEEGKIIYHFTPSAWGAGHFLIRSIQQLLSATVVEAASSDVTELLHVPVADRVHGEIIDQKVFECLNDQVTGDVHPYVGHPNHRFSGVVWLWLLALGVGLGSLVYKAGIEAFAPCTAQVLCSCECAVWYACITSFVSAKSCFPLIHSIVLFLPLPPQGVWAQSKVDAQQGFTSPR